MCRIAIVKMRVISCCIAFPGIGIETMYNNMNNNNLREHMKGMNFVFKYCRNLQITMVLVDHFEKPPLEFNK